MPLSHKHEKRVTSTVASQKNHSPCLPGIRRAICERREEEQHGALLRLHCDVELVKTGGATIGHAVQILQPAAIQCIRLVALAAAVLPCSIFSTTAQHAMAMQ